MSTPVMVQNPTENVARKLGSPIGFIAYNTFREAVRDRVLYNLIFFALLLVASAPLFGQISIGMERIILVNLGLSAIAIFGVVIAIFIGTGLVSKEIDKKTLYTVLSRPVRRWEFIVGKYFGLAWTLVVNTFFMSLGLYLAIFYVQKHLNSSDVQLLVAIYLIILELLIVTAIALLFSSFSTPLFSALFSFAMFVIGSSADDLRGFGRLAEGATKWIAVGLSYIVPNFGVFNVASQMAHGHGVSSTLVLQDSLYALVYTTAALSASVLIFERRNLK